MMKSSPWSWTNLDFESWFTTYLGDELLHFSSSQFSHLKKSSNLSQGLNEDEMAQ